MYLFVIVIFLPSFNPLSLSLLLFYRQAIRLVHAFNAHYGATVAAYTFDAGPNAVIFVPKMHHAALTAFMLHFFPKVNYGKLYSSAQLECIQSLFACSTLVYLLNSNHFSAIKQTLLSFIFPFFSHPPHDYSSSSFSSSSHPLSSSSSLIFFFYISQPTLENLATFTNRPDLLSAASKAHLPPALVQAGAATGRVPASGDIKMVRLQQERNRERERERDDLNRRRR